MEEVKIVQRGIIRFLTLEGVVPEQILKRLQKVYREETLPSSQVEYFAREMIVERRRFPLPMLVRNTDVMADVLGFLPRREIALRLACVNRRFSALCNCWCRQEADGKADENDVEAKSVSDASAATVPVSSAFERSKK